MAWWLLWHIGGGLALLVHWGLISTSNRWTFNVASVLYLIVGLVPGLALGGWKAVLVATGRSSIKGKVDIVWLSVFGLWTIGWTLMALPNLVRYW